MKLTSVSRIKRRFSTTIIFLTPLKLNQDEIRKNSKQTTTNYLDILLSFNQVCSFEICNLFYKRDLAKNGSASSLNTKNKQINKE